MGSVYRPCAVAWLTNWCGESVSVSRCDPGYQVCPFFIPFCRSTVKMGPRSIIAWCCVAFVCVCLAAVLPQCWKGVWTVDTSLYTLCGVVLYASSTFSHRLLVINIAKCTVGWWKVYLFTVEMCFSGWLVQVCVEDEEEKEVEGEKEEEDCV